MRGKVGSACEEGRLGDVRGKVGSACEESDDNESVILRVLVPAHVGGPGQIKGH